MGLRIGKFLGKVLKVVDKVVLAGAITNVTEDTAQNPRGRIDLVQIRKNIIYPIVLLILLYLLISGKIDFDQFEKILESADGLQN